MSESSTRSTTLESFSDTSLTPEEYCLGRTQTNSEAGFVTIDRYPYIKDSKNNKYLPIHRLVAVAEYGYDEVVDKHIHHENGVRFDNRPENLTPLSNSEHSKLESDNTPLSERLESASDEHVARSLKRAGYDDAADKLND